MEDSARTKIELMKPVLLKAGIPIAISVAGFVLARFTFGRKNSGLKDSANEFKFNNPPDLCNDQESCGDDLDILEGDQDLADMHSLDTLHAHNIHKLEEEIVSLKGKVKDLQGRELELKFRFLHYLEMKDQEMELTELENCLSFEILKTEFLDRELLSMEAETKRFEGMVIDFLKLARQLQISISENKALYKIITRLLSKAKEMSHVMQRKNKEIEAGETEMSSNNEELSRRANRISVLENELLEMRHITEKQEEENNELVNKLNLVENSASLKTEERAALEGYNQLVNEFEQLQRDRAAEFKEVVYLRWCNACLRHELIRRNQQGQNVEAKNRHQVELCFEENGLESESESSVILDDHGISSLECTTPSRDPAHSKRAAKLIEKFKRWVDGSQKAKRKNHGELVKCIGKHMVVSDGAEEIQISATNSCSSAYHSSPNGKN
ncbi:Peptidylprolyl isomerase [Heracleum sosnowskyi]|uniref:Peptidylprolyl isomerase n=1 Tax=Heracleum sosnowskyi TaxID=360622 RepID=A0AAD8N6F6_9APIA|nr:Peptidylprolyl isomerase [Heracleum sosnowskyi]